MDPIEHRLDRIEAKLDRVLNGPPPDVISAAECMPLTGCRSLKSQYRWFALHRVRPIERGRYRRLDITNTVAALALFPSRRPSPASPS